MSCMLQPPVTSLPPMAPAPGSADHAVSGARSGCQVLPLAAGGFWTRLAGHGGDGSCPRDPGTPRWRIRARVSARAVPVDWLLVVGEWCWATRPRSEYSQRGQFHSPHSHVLPSRCHTAAAPSVSVRADLCRPQHRPQVLRPRGRAQVSGKGSWQAWHTQSAEHARARAGLRGLRGGRRPPGDRREALRRQRQPPDPAADTCEHGGRCQPNPLLEPPAAARGRGPRACQAWANRGAFRRHLTARGPS